MKTKDYLLRLSELDFEASLNLPLDDVGDFDNLKTLQFIKKQDFLQRASLNKEKYTILFSKISEATREKIKALQNYSLETLLSIINQREAQYQFRNLDKLDEKQIRDIIEDLYLLDELKNEE